MSPDSTYEGFAGGLLATDSAVALRIGFLESSASI